MHAWLCENPIGVEALHWKELPTPEPKAGEVRIAIQAASLNFPDLLIVQNKYQMKPPLPFVPGSEYAGVVEAVGEGVTHLKVGDAVAAFGGTGGFGTHASSTAALVMPLPAGLRVRRRRGVHPHLRHDAPRAASTAAQLKAGETLLVLGAAGGVGTAAIQIGKVARRARHRRRVERREVRALPVDRRRRDDQLRDARNLRDELKAADRRQGPGRRLRPGRRRPRRAGVPLDRLARPLPRRRLRAGHDPGAAAQPGAAQGRVDRRRVLGRVRAARAEGQRAGAGRARALVRARARSSR